MDQQLDNSVIEERAFRLKDHRTRWTVSRVARLGFLVGQGLSAKRVADDPLVASTPNNVHRQAQRLGLSFRDSFESSSRLRSDWEINLISAASKRGLTREGLVKLLLTTVAREPNLIDNVLDDLE